ncbi:MAG: cupin domain-containing protein [Candidatus Kapabacteria bacterium]|nr:cupin domain-containing protein [Candidatus Kapabacteria bacterium]
MNSIENIFSNLPQSTDEIIEILVRSPNVRIERIISSCNNSPDGFWYDQDENEWVILLQGSAKIEFEDEMIDLKTGDYLLIPSHKKHRVAETSPTEKTIWLAVFY